MRKLLIATLLLSASFLHTQGGIGGKGGFGGKGGIGGGNTGSAPVNCGIQVENNSSTGNNGIAQGGFCTTGSDVNGYKVLGVFVYTAATGSGTVYVAIYPATSVSCGGGITECPTGAPVCNDNTGITPVANSWNEDTATAVTTSCGTLTANTQYALAENNNSATYGMGFDGATCPAGTGPAWFIAQTAGAWASINKAGVSGQTTNCPSIYLVLQPQ